MNLDQVASLDNLFDAWREFRRGKARRHDVLSFAFTLEDRLFALRDDLLQLTYRHGPYETFTVCDPKLRRIHKASVRDRVLHQALFRLLYPAFDTRFIHDSYSCRVGKGTHRGVRRLTKFARQVSANWHHPAYALKCDISQFFHSVDHVILLDLINRRVHDDGLRWLIGKIVESFWTTPNTGLPLGNVTSQLFANVYLHELDRFIKHELHQRYYLRYCDDFIILNRDRRYLSSLISSIQMFLATRLRLSLHANKIILRKFSAGIDFLGYVVRPHHTVLRTRTRRRMLKKVKWKRQQLEGELIDVISFNQTIQSYLGILKHCYGHKTKQKLCKISKFVLIGNHQSTVTQAERSIIPEWPRRWSGDIVY